VTAERDAARAQLAVYTIEAANGQGSARVLYLADHQQAILNARDLPPLGPGQVYQVWLIPEGGQPQGVGIFVDSSGEAGFSGDLSRFRRLAITIEPGYGSPAPTSAPILAGTLQ
jgi:anti-sigma-K factor RskA